MIFLVILVSAVGFSLAEFSDSSAEINELANGNLKISINEVFTPPTNWNGLSYEKNVSIKNSSTVDSIIRVSLVPRWIDGNGNPWAGDCSKITYKFSSYLYKGTDENIPVGNSMWIACNADNGVQYYYYNTIIKNNDVTNKLIEGVSFDTSGIDRLLLFRYSGKKLIVDVKAEAVMANPTVIEYTWGSSTGDAKIDKMLRDLCPS